MNGTTWALVSFGAAVIFLAGAASTVERTARQQRGWFGAFVGLFLLGLLAVGVGLYHLGVLK